MRLLRAGLSVLGLIAVSGCAPHLLPLADVQQLQARDGSYGQDIYGLRRSAGEPVPIMRGNQIVEIRTFTPKTNDFGIEVADQEVAGAECLVRAEDASVKIRTPGALHVPLYGYRSPDMSVQCIKTGFQDAVNTVPKFNLSQQQRQQAVANAAASGGLIGAVVGIAVGAAIAAANDPTDDAFNYRSPQLFLRPGQGSVTLPENVGIVATAATPAAAPAPQSAVEADAEPIEVAAAPEVVEPAQEVPEPPKPAPFQPEPNEAQVVTGTSLSADGIGTEESDTDHYGAFTTPGITEESSDWERKCKPFCS